MSISMELLAVKLQVLAQMLGIVGLAGLAVLAAAMIWMVIRASNFDSLIPPVIGVVLSAVLVGGGLACGPVSKESADLTAAAWMSGALDQDLGELRKTGESGDGGLGDALDPLPDADSPEEEVRPEAESELFVDGDLHVFEPTGQDGAEAQDAHPEQVPGAVNMKGGIPYEVTLDDWRLRMTFPSEWADRCTISTYPDSYNITHLQCCHAASREPLFDLWIVYGALDMNDPDQIHRWHQMANPEIIMEKYDSYLLLSEYSLDRIDPNNKEQMDEYLEMKADVPAIMKTVEMEMEIEAADHSVSEEIDRILDEMEKNLPY